MNFFYYESKNKIFFLGGRGERGGGRVSECFFTKNPNLKKIVYVFFSLFFFFFWVGNGDGG